MGNQMRYLSKPVTDCYFETGADKTYSYTAASMQGWRKYQEDRFVCIPDFYEDCSFFGVYDGHGGSEIAEFLKQRLHLEILDSLRTQDDIELALHLGFLSCDASIMEPENIAELNDMVEEENRGTALQILKNQKSLEAAMSQVGEDQSYIAGPSAKPTFTENLFNAGSSAGAVMQQFFQNIAGPSQESISSKQDSEEMMEVERPLHYLLSDDIEPSDPEDEDYNIEEDEESSSTESEEETNCISTEEFLSSEPGYLSGSTATVAIIRQNRIYVANVGDSRCVLSRKGQAIDMSLDHKPDDPEEQARIIGAGGSVSEDGRVDNCLNLSRAFGDFKFKGDSFVPSQQCITSEPFIKSVDIEKDDDFLIIASDGIWNSMSSQEVVDYINIRLQTGDSDLKDICEEMFKFTLASDKDNDGTGCDNMCCIIIKFGNKGDSSFIYKACVSNEVMSSDGSLKQEGKNVNAPTSGSDDQITTNISEKTSPVDEKNSQDSHLTAWCPKQSLQHLVNSHWIDFSLRQEKCGENLIVKLILIDEVKKRFANHENNAIKITSDFSQSDMQHSVCSLKQKEALNLKENLETSVSPLLEDMASCKKDQGLEKPLKLAYLRDLDFANSYVEQIVYYFKNTQFKEVFPGLQINNTVNLADSNCKICLPISSEKQYLCNKYTSNIFNNIGHLITVRC
ncbi:putative protein phosphatase CG10417 [Araneus ventricosus]|uniref:protein-serine/threonine phosphatase n=1 Tax=Araneus ventricosus TaxID=182803 RepID=A0A4Y2AIK1_ARAVE|nr:putative protein phosphatase CG10417 [Araneus ventricosus]